MPIMFPDPIHGAIAIPSQYRDVIESPALARLRNVKQLGFTPSLYVGAVHTRFEHTLGTVAVITRLLDQFGVCDDGLRNRAIMAALLSEIGTPPLSYSTRSIFQEGNKASKRVYAKELYDTFLAQYGLLTAEDYELIWSSGEKHEDDWFTAITPLQGLPEISLTKLSNDIDYVLRDSYYSGRYQRTFDWRRFRSLDREDAAEIREAVRELYRSIYALHAVYGDKRRRFLNLILARLVESLTGMGLVDFSLYRDPRKFVELDDDTFLSIVRGAVEKSEDDLVRRMFGIIMQLEPMRIDRVPFGDDLKNVSLQEIESALALRQSKNARAVFCLNDAYDNQLGYTLFGRQFESFQSAVESDYFKMLTGLAGGGDKTGLLDADYIYLVSL